MSDEHDDDYWKTAWAEEEARLRGQATVDKIRGRITERLSEQYRHGELLQEQYEERIRGMYGRSFRRFVLDRNTDVTGVSGTGIVAEGVEFSDGVVALRWRGAWPTSVVFHDRGFESVLRVHGHDGRTVVRFLDGPTAGEPKQHDHEHPHTHGLVHDHDHIHEGDHDHEH